MIEEWRDIKGYEGYYQVSNLGRVRSLDRWVIHKNGKKVFNKSIYIRKSEHLGYYFVTLSKNSFSKKISVHRLVFSTFKNFYDYKKNVVNHRDGNKDNNKLKNLEVVSKSQNSKHAHKNNLIKVREGENHPNSKLNENTIREIYNRKKNGEKLSVLSKEYKICSSTLSSIFSGKKWKHLNLKPITKSKRRLKEREVLKIFYDCSGNITQLSKKYMMSRTNISDIKNRKIHKHITEGLIA